jgi:hypothetical protein
VPSLKQRKRADYEAQKTRLELVPEESSPYQAKALQIEGAPYQDQDEDQEQEDTRGVEGELEDSGVKQMRLLLLLYSTGDVEPLTVPELPRLNDAIGAATENDRRLYELLRVRFGLRMADTGMVMPLPLATSELVRERITITKGGASQLIHRFEDAGVIHYAGSLPPLGKGHGTRTFLPGPPSWS